MEVTSQGNDKLQDKSDKFSDEKHTTTAGYSAISRAVEAVRDYLEYDFECLLSDVTTLTRMNKASTERYMELTTSTNDMTRKLTDVNSRFDSLHDALKKIDHFNQDIEHLEKKASEIDMLTKQLEDRYNKLLETQIK
uniref:Biogenesis of lysosome-related organelles complex 1 subunit 2 n=1 Tax=Trichobilharzia regenti TaxID=157069 RepID=A0AA85J209_TRIRE|nr:unnamed protein product [Trichobilharzia regenti]